MIEIGSGDGWVHCVQGHKHWGRFGAAGLLVRFRVADDPTGVDRILLQHRAAWSHHGGTWGIPGGARDRGESAGATALREAAEESTLDTRPVVPLDEYVDDHGGWTYTTVVVRAGWAGVATPPAIEVRGAESTELRWVRSDHLDRLDLHPGFATTWPLVRSLGVHVG